MALKSDLLKQFERQFPDAIDSSLVHGSRSDAENYAANNPIAYSGQILSYLDDKEQKPAIVQPDGSLKDIAGQGVALADLEMQQANTGQKERHGEALTGARSDHFHALPASMPCNTYEIEFRSDVFSTSGAWYRAATSKHRTNSMLYLDLALQSDYCQIKLDLSILITDMNWDLGNVEHNISLQNFAYLSNNNNNPAIQKIRIAYLKVPADGQKHEFYIAVDFYKRSSSNQMRRYTSYSLGNNPLALPTPSILAGGNSSTPPPLSDDYAQEIINLLET